MSCLLQRLYSLVCCFPTKAGEKSICISTGVYPASGMFHFLCVSNYYFFFQGLHPRIITEGFDKARVKTLEILEKLKIEIKPTHASLLDVARTSLRTKIHQQLADVLTDVNETTMFCISYILFFFFFSPSTSISTTSPGGT